jgi:hypothetical protein
MSAINTDRMGYQRFPRDHALGDCWEITKADIDGPHKMTVDRMCEACMSELLHADTHHVTCGCDWVDRWGADGTNDPTGRRAQAQVCRATDRLTI